MDGNILLLMEIFQLVSVSSMDMVAGSGKADQYWTNGKWCTILQNQ